MQFQTRTGKKLAAPVSKPPTKGKAALSLPPPTPHRTRTPVTPQSHLPSAPFPARASVARSSTNGGSLVPGACSGACSQSLLLDAIRSGPSLPSHPRPIPSPSIHPSSIVPPARSRASTPRSSPVPSSSSSLVSRSPPMEPPRSPDWARSPFQHGIKLDTSSSRPPLPSFLLFPPHPHAFTRYTIAFLTTLQSYPLVKQHNPKT